MLVATPSGLTLAPEGGAHQSIHPPLIGMAQDKLAYFEPAFADELAEIMRWGFGQMQEPDGESIYLRLSTRSLDQPRSRAFRSRHREHPGRRLLARTTRPRRAIRDRLLRSHRPRSARGRSMRSGRTIPTPALLAVTSPDRLYRSWFQSLAASARGIRRRSHIDTLLAQLPAAALLVTVMDGPPQTLSWLAGVSRPSSVPSRLRQVRSNGRHPGPLPRLQAGQRRHRRSGRRRRAERYRR